MFQQLLNPLLAQFGRTAFVALIAVLMKVSFLRSPSTFDTSYDYVIVGGGAAGCVLANRLSEDPNVKVLLIEAGPEENFLTDIPLFQTYVRGSPLDWNIVSEPNLYSNQEHDGHRMGLFQGKVLGGTTVINAMLYVRGSRYDYDTWRRLGVTGWSYESNLKYFIKSENNHVQSIKNSPFHGTNGPLHVSLPQYKTKLGLLFNEAGARLGYRSHIDYNGRSATGFSINQNTIYRGSRVSAAKAYIDPIIKRRKNLRVLTFSTVTKILLAKNSIGNVNNKNKFKVQGVELFSKPNEAYYQVKARKEVILSAGAINSPKILMLSGIGDCNQLIKHNIKCLINRPAVGKNLMDHIGAGFTAFTVSVTGLTSSVRDITPSAGYEYFKHGRGVLTSSFVDALAFIDVNSNSTVNTKRANIEFILGTASLLSDYGSTLQRSEFMSKRLWREYEKYSGLDSFTIYPVLLTPKSRGMVTLRSADPFDKPKVQMNYLSVKEDVDTFIKGIKIVLKLIAEEPFQRIGAKILPIKFPLCPRARFLSDEYLKCALKSYTVSFWHFSGTARMGQVGDPNAVTDNRLNVIGVQGLRVVDASVMPVVTTGHLQAPVYMIAEKAADMIKGII